MIAIIPAQYDVAAYSPVVKYCGFYTQMGMLVGFNLTLFKQCPENEVYAPDHNSFFKSPDGKEDWILCHANSQPSQGCGGKRSPRAQKFTRNKDGTPNFDTKPTLFNPGSN